MKHTIHQGDTLRPLLTDLIPYEVPLRFSFLNIHELLHKKDSLGKWTKILFSKSGQAKFYIPYSYSIMRGEGKSRTLSLIHPLLLEQGAALYTNFAGVIVSLCGKSNWSLRRPVRVAKMYYGKQDKYSVKVKPLMNSDDGGGVQEIGLSVEEQNLFQEHASSYFVYEPFNLIHKFIESRELTLIEHRFSKSRRIDIARCFDNIYSHSISWAVKGKAAAKIEASCKHTFDSLFDRFMRMSNHGETHGILIGAELSRIFAEIILQEVDLRTREGLQSTHFDAKSTSVKFEEGLHDGRDFMVKRYIDDYFIFYNEDRVADAVQNEIENQLARYKLFINEKKTLDSNRPFVTALSAAKGEICNIIKEQLDFDHSEDAFSAARGVGKRFNGTKILNQLRLRLAQLDVRMADVTASLLKLLSNILNKKLSLFKNGHVSVSFSLDWIDAVLEIAFYLFATDIRFRTGVLVGRIMSDLAANIGILPQPIQGEVEDKIFRHVSTVLKQVAESRSVCRLEMANFLICVRSLKNCWRIPESLLIGIFPESHGKDDDLDYFSIIALLYFIRHRAEYNALRDRLYKTVIIIVTRSINILEDTEAICLGLDILSCPWFPRASKNIIAGKFLEKLSNGPIQQDQINAFVNETSSKTWFFDWRETVSNRIFLQKKELLLSY